MRFFLKQKNTRIGSTEAGSKSGWLNYVSSRLQQRHQTAFGVQGHQIVTAAHMRVANEDLRHRTPARDFHHVGACLGVGVDADFFNLGHAFGVEQLLGSNAIRANGGGVHLDGGHGDFSELIQANKWRWLIKL
jgi:hypothetical protein